MAAERAASGAFRCHDRDHEEPWPQIAIGTHGSALTVRVLTERG